MSQALRYHYPHAKIISYDIDPRCATKFIDSNHEFRLVDVRDIDPKALKHEVGSPLFIWASPPCTQYSIARSYAKSPRDLTGADSIVKACMHIIECLQPERWAMENPYTGLLKGREVVAPWAHYLKKTSYCKFGFNYKKDTCIWTNVEVELPTCSRLTPCNASSASGGRKHPETAQKGFSGTRDTLGQNSTHRLHRVPAGLIALLVV